MLSVYEAMQLALNSEGVKYKHMTFYVKKESNSSNTSGHVCKRGESWVPIGPAFIQLT